MCCCQDKSAWRREKWSSDQVGGVLCFSGPFVQKLVIRSSTSEGLLLRLDGLLPAEERAAEEQSNAEGDEEKQSQESAST